MHRSSESVAALAAALAKAQTELVNPEKSLIATIPTGRAGEATRTFRYAPLSSGLDIVRRTLGQHEIATVQTTAIEAGVVKLTTMLAHASGEWIASDWPVCPVAETANPQRMGAALTYARRYALFTLVGIAGEDDLDAPDLCAPAPGALVSAKTSGNGGMTAVAKRTNSSILPLEQSAALRDRLISEIASLDAQDSAAAWAKEALPRKNTLTATDARMVETAFALKQSVFSLSSEAEPSSRDLLDTPDPAAMPAAAGAPVTVVATAKPLATTGSDDGDAAPRIDKSVLALSTPKRYHNKGHLRFVIQQPCLLCGRKPSDAHHIRFAQARALGRKASDEFTVPLCRTHHRSVHRAGDEQAWWQQAGIDPLKVARKLWKHTRTEERWADPDPQKSPTVASEGAAAPEPEGPAVGTQPEALSLSTQARS
jgi:hypothetical protein